MLYSITDMNQGSGYTILEVMIFIAISGFMLISAMLAIGGRQQEVQFQQATRDFERKINDLVSDVNVGYFERDAGFACESVGASPRPSITYTLGVDGNTQGETGDCTLIGKTIIMSDEPVLASGSNDVSDKQVIRIFDMAGLRIADNVTNEPAQDVEEALPTALFTSNSPVDIYELDYGLSVEKVIMLDQDSSNPVVDQAAGAIAFMNNARAGSELDATVASGERTGSTSAQIVTATFNSSISAATGILDFANNWRFAGDGSLPDFSSLAICMAGPNARNVTGDVSNWNNKETAALLVEKTGTTRLVYDQAEDFCA